MAELKESLTFYQSPKLSKPILVMGFEGWADAGRVSSGTVAYLRDKLGARRLAEIRPDEFYLFGPTGLEARRPPIDVENGLVKALDTPTTRFWFYQNQSSDQDLIISLGPEPELAWNKYVQVVLDFAQELNVERIYTIGGTFDRVPHTIEPIITALVSEPSLIDEMREYGIGLANYQGPTAIHSLVLVSAGRRGIRTVGLWGHAPHYIQVPNTKVCYHLLLKLSKMLKLSLNLDNVKRAAEYLDAQVNEVINQKAELKEYIRGLEEEYRQGKPEGEPLREDIIKEIEEFLRERREKGED